ncbi:MAG: sensor histidine kinase [Acholeplasmataceae bacterium]
MIKKLRYKFLINALIAFLIAMFALVVILNLFITINFTEAIDSNLDRIMELETDDIVPPDGMEDPIFRGFDQRLFVVYFDSSNTITDTKMSFPDMIDTTVANTYATQALTLGDERGWSDNYRYLIGHTDTQTIIVFVDGDFFAYAITQFRNISLIALGITTILVAAFLYFASKSAIKPIAISQERQKQFMTDASHELKTPLTVISANAEILKMNDPENEWILGIQKQTTTLTHLIQQIIKMSRLDESELSKLKHEVNLSDLILTMIEDFKIVAKKKQLELSFDIEDQVIANLHEPSMIELIGILLDNAVKYGDEQGDVKIKLYKHKKIHFWISNQYNLVNNLDLSSLFDRFYRADDSRKSDGSFGLGLSIAKSIVELHQGSIKAIKVNDHEIAFEVIL